ncbi:hypothetical protein D623_10017908 [Myotis brandtii]|uniref:Uncharacterized protein n=1 Tax=Myotis brandtii TaxID=109478 RepID=S7MIP1_MYOBR|nr:hypothetical protein D623_10017908 [Myotis brandtii]
MLQTELITFLLDALPSEAASSSPGSASVPHTHWRRVDSAETRGEQQPFYSVFRKSEDIAKIQEGQKFPKTKLKALGTRGGRRGAEQAAPSERGFELYVCEYKVTRICIKYTLELL